MKYNIYLIMNRLYVAELVVVLLIIIMTADDRHLCAAETENYRQHLEEKSLLSPSSQF